MTTNDIPVLIDGLTNLVNGAVSLIAYLESAVVPKDRKPEAPAETPEKTFTYEEARAVLAEKARRGCRAEVKAILTQHGVSQLSEVKDPSVLAALVAEAEAISPPF